MKRNFVILLLLPIFAFGLGMGTWLFVGDINKFIANPAAAATCGDWVIENPPETCDDGNTDDGDGCSSTCAEEAASCGNNITERAEYCDDGGESAECTAFCNQKCSGDGDCDYFACWRNFGTPHGDFGAYSEYSTNTCFFGECQGEFNMTNFCTNETGPTVCRDGIDNDGDSDTDCDDSDCSSDATCSCVISEGPPEVTCNDSSDNDCDGNTDCADSDCDSETCDTGKTCQSGVCSSPPSTDCNNDGTDDGANEDCSNCPNDAYDCESDEKCINGSCTDTDGTCAREDVCGDGWVGPNEACDDGGICKGSSNAAFENQDCSTLDSTLIAGVARCRATGGWCQAQDDDGCTWDCQDECIPSAGPCLVDGDCCGGTCTNGICEVCTGGSETCDDGIDNDDCDVLVDCEDTADCPDTTACQGGGKCYSGTCCGDGTADAGEECNEPAKSCTLPDVCNNDTCRCESSCDPNETHGANCKDGLDNDCDGLWDCLDTDCHGDATSCDNCPVAWPFSYPVEMFCADGIDNDCDGHIDCNDQDDCFVACGLSCPGVPEICDNNHDDDCDGMADCSDSPECDGQACYPPGGTCNGGMCQ